eukprot:1160477-Pelagomonas_calceolata.AAC.2
MHRTSGCKSRQSGCFQVFDSSLDPCVPLLTCIPRILASLIASLLATLHPRILASLLASIPEGLGIAWGFQKAYSPQHPGSLSAQQKRHTPEGLGIAMHQINQINQINPYALLSTLLSWIGTHVAQYVMLGAHTALYVTRNLVHAHASTSSVQARGFDIRLDTRGLRLAHSFRAHSPHSLSL